MRRLATLLCLLLLAALPVAGAEAKVRKGPAGLKFYSPPHALVAGKHGTLIWARKLTGAAALRGGAASRLILYRSTGVDGKHVVVSGTVAVPKGKAPKGGWPVVSWAHGTTGIADQCAPSRDSASNPAHRLIAYAYPLLRRWSKAGFAVVQTDYTGLGTPGAHPYLVGGPEGDSVLDAVRAARKLDRRIGTRMVIAGHSQGGHAALYAAALAPKYTPELKLRGTLALAPASHISDQAALLPALTAPNPLSGFVSLILRGIDVAQPQLGIPGALNGPAAALYPQTLTRCLPALSRPSSFGAIAPADLTRPGVDFSPFTAAVSRLDDPEDLVIRSPVRVQQGTADQTVFQTFTDQLVDAYTKRGMKVSYQTYPGVSHGGAVTNATSAADATKYIRAQLH